MAGIYDVLANSGAPNLQQIRMQGDRVAQMLRQAASPQQDFMSQAQDLSNLRAAAMNPSGGLNFYNQQKQMATDEQHRSQELGIKAEMTAYDQLLKAREMGNQEAAAIYDKAVKIAGPDKAADLLNGLENDVPDEITSDSFLSYAVPYAKTRGLISRINPNAPAAIQEYEYYKSLGGDEQRDYLKVKRSDQLMNLGGTYGVRSPGGGLSEVYPVTPKPEQMPDFQSEQERAKGVGKNLGEKQNLLSSMQSKIPELEQTVIELDDLGKISTYGYLGRAEDTMQRELGMDVGEDARARAAYIAKVDNQVLPLLRDTFGAQFTEREGQTLRATLGDPNLSPTEKSAALKAFIDQKRASIESLQREVGFAPTPGSVEDGYVFLGGDPSDPKSWRKQ